MTTTIPRFRKDIPITNEHGQPSFAFHLWWQNVAKSLEDQLNTINGQLAVLVAAAQADATAAQADATAAQTDATAAQSDATAAARESARIVSYTNPTNVLTAAEVGGTSITITIAGHTRVYPVQGSIDVPDVSITGGTLTGKAYTTTYYIYYDDTTLALTAPTFVATTTPATAQVGAAAGRHFVGVITTPAHLGGSTGGSGGSPPGGNGGNPLP